MVSTVHVVIEWSLKVLNMVTIVLKISQNASIFEWQAWKVRTSLHFLLFLIHGAFQFSKGNFCLFMPGYNKVQKCLLSDFRQEIDYKESS